MQQPKTDTAEDSMEGAVGPERKRMPVDREGLTCKIEIYDESTGQTQEGYITANRMEDGSLGEIFLADFGKAGSTLEGWTQLAAVLFSTALQYNAEFPVLVRKIAHMRFPPYGPTNSGEVPYCRSVPDFIVRWLAHHFGDEDLHRELKEIDEEMERAAGC